MAGGRWPVAGGRPGGAKIKISRKLGQACPKISAKTPKFSKEIWAGQMRKPGRGQTPNCRLPDSHSHTKDHEQARVTKRQVLVGYFFYYYYSRVEYYFCHPTRKAGRENERRQKESVLLLVLLLL